MLLAVGLFAVTGALLLLALVVLPAGPRRVPLSRLDPAVTPPASALAGAAVERVLARRGLVAR